MKVAWENLDSVFSKLWDFFVPSLFNLFAVTILLFPLTYFNAAPQDPDASSGPAKISDRAGITPEIAACIKNCQEPLTEEQSFKGRCRQVAPPGKDPRSLPIAQIDFHSPAQGDPQTVFYYDTDRSSAIPTPSEDQLNLIESIACGILNNVEQVADRITDGKFIESAATVGFSVIFSTIVALLLTAFALSQIVLMLGLLVPIGLRTDHERASLTAMDELVLDAPGNLPDVLRDERRLAALYPDAYSLGRISAVAQHELRGRGVEHLQIRLMEAEEARRRLMLFFKYWRCYLLIFTGILIASRWFITDWTTGALVSVLSSAAFILFYGVFLFSRLNVVLAEEKGVHFRSLWLLTRRRTIHAEAEAVVAYCEARKKSRQTAGPYSVGVHWGWIEWIIRKFTLPWRQGGSRSL